MYPLLRIEEFGRILLETNDLDPVYVALWKMRMGDDKLARWLLAYWCFYNCGLASYLSEFSNVAEYWEMLKIAAENIENSPIGGKWPRGKERRHFRGDKCVLAIYDLERRYPNGAIGFVNYVANGNRCCSVKNPATLKEVTGRVQEHDQFGPWIGFKVADMLERIGGCYITFDDGQVMMFTDPVQGALMAFKAWGNDVIYAEVEDAGGSIPYTVDRLKQEFGLIEAPPRSGRLVGIQEIETILCKWKSHQRGHYPLLNDIVEVGHGAAPWATVSETAKHFVASLPTPTIQLDRSLSGVEVGVKQS